MATYSAYNLNRIRNPEMRKIVTDIMDIASGHDHDGTNSKAATAGSVSDGAITYAKCDAGVKASLDLADTALQAGELELTSGTPTNAKAATGTLTLVGVVKHGETVTVGADVYEFRADAAQTLTAGSTIAVDIEGNTTKAAGVLTVDTHPALGDTFTIGTKVYTIVPTGSANGEGDVARGADLPACKVNIVAAINGSDGHNTANPVASAAAFIADACAITALAGGTAGNAIATTETFTAGSNVFAAVVLAAGADCLAPAAITAFVAAVTASDTAGVSAVDGAGDTVVLTADTSGTAGNSIATTKTLSNGSFAAATLVNGSAGTVGDQWQTYVDSSYLYVCIAANTVNDANWRRISLGTVY